MSITIGNQRKAVSFDNVTGLGKFSVAGFCLTKGQLEKLGVTYIKEEPKFIDTRDEVTQFNMSTGESEKLTGVKRRMVSIWLRFESEKVSRMVK